MPATAMGFACDTNSFAPHHQPAVVKEFDLIREPRRHRISVRRARKDDIPVLLQRAEGAIGARLASASVVEDVAAQHPDALWTFTRSEQIVGGFAMLMLNSTGLAALLCDEIDLARPLRAFIQRPETRPAAIYVWAVLGTSISSEGIAQIIVRLQAPPYQHADIYALPTTADGLRFMQKLGLHPVPGHPRGLHRYIRLANRSNFGEVS